MIRAVHHDQLSSRERVLRVRLAADPASVPGARRFVEEGLRSWGHDSLVDDATLCVSELAGNAALHGNGSFMEVSVQDLQRAVRLCVEDDGAAPAAAIAPRTSLPGLDEEFDAHLDELESLLNAPATGRGLAIVSVLARDWGVEELDKGKRVWADLYAGEAEPASEPIPSPGRHASAPGPTPSSRQTQLPEGWSMVRLVGCPVDLSIRQEQHLDELVRELTLMSLDTGNGESAALVRRLEVVLHAPAQAREAGGRQAREARARGEAVVEVTMAVPQDFGGQMHRLEQAVCDADRLCDEQRLLTLTSPTEVRQFRTWVTQEIVGQLEHGARPVPWAAWLAAR